MRTHIGTNLDAKDKHLLEDWLIGEIAVTWGQEIENPENIDVLVSGRPTKEQLDACPNLQKLIFPFAGVPSASLELLKKYPRLEVHNLHHNAVPTAEMAVTLMLAAAKFVVPYDRLLRSGDWSPRYEPPRSLLIHQKRLLIAGFGAVGRHIAKICLAMEMKVLAIRKSIETKVIEDNGVEVYPVADLDVILPTIDILINSLPLTPETNNFFDHGRLAQLPQGCILVNIGRAQTIHEEALFNALSNGQIGAAGFDVWYNYPGNLSERTNTLPSSFPIFDMENVVLSPHRGGATNQSEEQRYKALADLLNNYYRGEQVPNQIDINRGY